MTCLNKDPTQRYPSAEALAQDVERFLEGGRDDARPPGFWRRLTRWFSRGADSQG
jgi:serine/threonine-protein kinase